MRTKSNLPSVQEMQEQFRNALIKGNAQELDELASLIDDLQHALPGMRATIREYLKSGRVKLRTWCLKHTRPRREFCDHIAVARVISPIMPEGLLELADAKAIGFSVAETLDLMEDKLMQAGCTPEETAIWLRTQFNPLVKECSDNVRLCRRAKPLKLKAPQPAGGAPVHEPSVDAEIAAVLPPLPTTVPEAVTDGTDVKEVISQPVLSQ